MATRSEGAAAVTEQVRHAVQEHRASRQMTVFDSSTVMTRKLAQYLEGRQTSPLGQIPRTVLPLAQQLTDAVNRLPWRVRVSLARINDAISPLHLSLVRAEPLARWVVRQYPRRSYPGMMVGSSNGALTHLCALMGMPALPQTLLIVVRNSGLHVDEPTDVFAEGSRYAQRLLRHNSEWNVVQMHDPNQDRVTARFMLYFRVKRTTLGTAYRDALGMLAPGAPIFVSDCQQRWPATKVSERLVFQHGGMGGAAPSDYERGSRDVEQYLRRYGSPTLRWEFPPLDTWHHEAEWGFDPALLDDIDAYAARHGHPVIRISFEHPEAVSPLVADLHRWQYQLRGMPASRLIAESFMLLDPWWVQRTGAAPFWMVFSTDPSRRALRRYLDERDDFDELYATLFPHGVESVGWSPLERWKELLSRAPLHGVLGLDDDAYPADLSAFMKYQPAFARLPGRYPVPGPMAVRDLDRFLTDAGDRYDVTVTRER